MRTAAGTQRRQPLHDLAEQYKQHVNGQPMRWSPGVAAFPGLLVDQQGWRPDGMARTRAFLTDALSAYSGRRGAPDMARATAMHFGLTGPPMSAREVAAVTQAGTEDTVASWWKRVFDDPGVCAHAASRAGAVQAERVPDGLAPRAGWPSTRPAADVTPDYLSEDVAKPPAAWPPSAWPTGLGDGHVDEAAALRAAVGGLFPHRTDEGITLSSLSQLAAKDVPDHLCVRTALRDVVAPRLVAWFAEAKETEREIWVRKNVIEAWYAFDAFAALLPTGPVAERRNPSGQTYGQSVAVVAQMMMWEAAADVSALVAATRTRFDVAHRLRFMGDLDPLQGLGPSLQQLAVSGRLAVREVKWARRLPRIVLAAGVDAGTAAGVSAHLDVQAAGGLTPASALDAARAIRALTDPPMKRRIIGEYLRGRPEMAARARNQREHVLLALADQSVHWDTVTNGDQDYAERLAAEIRADPAHARWGYLGHTMRCLAMFANKNEDWGRAFGFILEGLDDLADVTAHGLVDTRELIESEQQIYLAGAGVAVRRLERTLLLAPSGPSDHVAAIARTALWLSAAAMSSLLVLEKQDLLPAQRHEYDQIAFLGWRVQARIVRIRVMAAVLTAMAAGLVEPSRLTGQIRPDIPLHPIVPPTAADAEVSLDSLVAAYRELQHVPQVGRDRAGDLVPIGLWVAFLNHGLLPTEDNPAPGFVEACEILARDDDQMGLREIPIDVRRAVLWLQNRDLDALVLSWLKPHTVARNALNRTSGGAYEDFRREHDPVKPEIASRD